MSDVLLRDVPFVDFHIVSTERVVEDEEDEYFEKGVRGFAVKDGETYRLQFSSSKNVAFEGIFFKEIGTDFNNGVFKFTHKGKLYKVHVTNDVLVDPLNNCPFIKEDSFIK